MSNYTKITDYAAKDLLLHLDPLKAIKGTEVGAEFDAIATMSATKTDAATLAAAGGAALVGNTPAGNISATTVQAALNELDAEKALLAGSASQAFSASTFTGALSGNATTATTATHLAGGSGGTIPYQSAAGTTAMLANGTAGQLLQSNGTTLAPTWVPSPTTAFASSAENAAGTIENKAVDPLGIREAFNATGTAPIYACRAWVNFNGTGTVAIRASGNVSSITDNGVGNYTANFATAMPDANYSYGGNYDFAIATLNNAPVAFNEVARLAGSFQFRTNDGTGAALDSEVVCLQFFR